MAMAKTWRERAAPIIKEVLETNSDKPLKEVRKLLRDAYPFGQREYHPYFIWCDEVNTQLGLKTKKTKKINNIKQLNLF